MTTAPLRKFDSFVDFYADTYGDAVRDRRPAGRTGAIMIEAAQGIGDWSDAPVPDLVLVPAWSGVCDARMDIGAGHFDRKGRWSADMILIPPNTPTSIFMSGEHIVRPLAIPYEALLRLLRDDAKLFPSDGDFGQLHAGSFHDPLIVRLLADLWAEAGQGSPQSALFADGVLIQLASRLLHLASGPARASRRTFAGGLAPWQERQALEFLSCHIADEVLLETLAETTQLSTWHFARAFKVSTGLPPHAYLRKLRCEKAAKLLSETSLPIQQIASSVGYETPQAFARMFRAEVGASPSEYRRERRR